MKSQKTLGCLLVFVAIFGSVSASAYTERSTMRHKFVLHSSSYNDDSNIIGVQGGLVLANSSVSNGNPGVDTGSRLGFDSGFYYEHRFIPYFGLRVGMDFTQRGYTMNDGQGFGAISITDTASYLEFPILLKTQYKVGIVTPYVLTGPCMGLLVSKGETVSQNGQSQDRPLNNTINTFNFSWNFGGGVDFEIVRHFNLEIGARYSLGLLNVLSDQAAAGGTSIKLNSLQFLSGVALSI